MASSLQPRTWSHVLVVAALTCGCEPETCPGEGEPAARFLECRDDDDCETVQLCFCDHANGGIAMATSSPGAARRHYDACCPELSGCSILWQDTPGARCVDGRCRLSSTGEEPPTSWIQPRSL